MEKVLKIDPEFQNKIPPLTEEEFRQLEENIMDAGEVFEPIVVWNDTIVDGHNRYKIILMHPGIRWRTREVSFESKWDAFDWMYRNQLGRRNLTDEQKTFLLGKLYEARKRVVGNKTSARNPDGTFQPDQNERNGQRYAETADEIAAEQKIGSATVKRAGQYAKGIDVIRDDDPELADAILTAERKVPKIDVINLGKAEPCEREQMIEDIKASDGKRRRNRNVTTREIESLVDDMADHDTVMKYTVSMMKEQIRLNAEAFVRSLYNLLNDHSDIRTKNHKEINKEIDCIIAKLEALKGDIE